MSLVEQTRMTPEELLRMPEADHAELVDGQLLEQEMSVESAWIATECVVRIRNFAGERHLGLAIGDGLGYRCFGDDHDLVRRPDASFIAKGRLSKEQFSEGYCLVAPDLAVEVVSPGDLYFDVHRKVGEYRRAGVRLIWVVSPAERRVTVYRGNGEVIELAEHEELTGADVLPGFRCRVSDLFPSAEMTGML